MSDNGNAVLKAHRANLANSKTFEEYRDHQVAYVDFLIAREEAKTAAQNAEIKFVYRSVEAGIAEIVKAAETQEIQ